MNLIKQNDRRMPPSIQLYGCRFRCLLAMVEFEKKKAFNSTQILSIYKDIVDSGDMKIMNSNCLCGESEHEICEIGFQYLKSKNKKIRQYGYMKDGVPMSWADTAFEYDYCINHWLTNTKDGHYTLSDNNGNEIYDPWNHVLGTMKLENIKRKLLYKVLVRNWDFTKRGGMLSEN